MKTIKTTPLGRAILSVLCLYPDGATIADIQFMLQTLNKNCIISYEKAYALLAKMIKNGYVEKVRECDGVIYYPLININEEFYECELQYLGRLWAPLDPIQCALIEI